MFIIAGPPVKRNSMIRGNATDLMKSFFKKIKNGWMLFAQKLARINTVILLTIIYVMIVGPMALIAKMFRLDPLQRKRDTDKKSYWLNRISSEPTIERHKFQF